MSDPRAAGGMGSEWATGSQIDPSAPDPTGPEVTQKSDPDCFVEPEQGIEPMIVDPIPFGSGAPTAPESVPTGEQTAATTEEGNEIPLGLTSTEDGAEESTKVNTGTTVAFSDASHTVQDSAEESKDATSHDSSSASIVSD